jgi:hypothetical protein
MCFCFSKIENYRLNEPKNCPRHRAERDAIEFERSENQGQFFIYGFLIIFNTFKYF